MTRSFRGRLPGAAGNLSEGEGEKREKLIGQRQHVKSPQKKRHRHLKLMKIRKIQDEKRW